MCVLEWLFSLDTNHEHGCLVTSSGNTPTSETRNFIAENLLKKPIIFVSIPLAVCCSPAPPVLLNKLVSGPFSVAHCPCVAIA